MSESEMRIINNKQRNTQLGIIFNSQFSIFNYPRIIPIIVADSTETRAPPIMAGTPIREINPRFSGANTPNPPNKIPIDDILANPQRI